MNVGELKKFLEEVSDETDIQILAVTIERGRARYDYVPLDWYEHTYDDKQGTLQISEYDNISD